MKFVKNTLLYSALLSLLVIPTQGREFLENHNEILENTKNHLLSLAYNLQPPQVEAPVFMVSYFSDIESGAWYEQAAHYVVERQIMAATSSTTFSPYLPVSRGIAATVITNAEKADMGNYPNAFADASNQWYRDSVNWCAQNNLLLGYTEDMYGGNDPVSREEFALILYQYAIYTGKSTENNSTSALSAYPDQSIVSSYARTALAWALNERLLFANNGYLEPDAAATRADVAVATMKFIETLS